ncbi:alpha/beta hydrolase [Amycolatopsis sp. NPDC021455]|uniref:alpha/beta fold hydrolase n=1 Tax=Amycolatopsis sp. NPDC021455 TaxID=3154901 RepID=UPI00340AE0F1
MVGGVNIISPVVLVPGMWHGSWAWSLVTERLAGRGVPSIAVDLDGHGLKRHSPTARWARPFDSAAYAAEPTPSAGVTASSAAATLVEQLRRIGGGRPCVVVAHSMAGCVATAAVETAPELFAELVYLAAFAPVTGVGAVQSLATPENAGEQVSRLLIGDAAAIGALRIDPGDRARHADIRDAFYHDVEERTAEAAISLLGDDGPLGIPGEAVSVTLQRFGAVSHTYIVCLDDRAVPLALQRRFVDEIDAVSAHATTVVELATSHSPFLSAPDDLAAAIALVHQNAVSVH